MLPVQSQFKEAPVQFINAISERMIINTHTETVKSAALAGLLAVPPKPVWAVIIKSALIKSTRVSPHHTGPGVTGLGSLGHGPATKQKVVCRGCTLHGVVGREAKVRKRYDSIGRNPKVCHTWDLRWTSDERKGKRPDQRH